MWFKIQFRARAAISIVVLLTSNSSSPSFPELKIEACHSCEISREFIYPTTRNGVEIVGVIWRSKNLRHPVGRRVCELWHGFDKGPSLVLSAKLEKRRDQFHPHLRMVAQCRMYVCTPTYISWHESDKIVKQTHIVHAKVHTCNCYPFSVVTPNNAVDSCQSSQSQWSNSPTHVIMKYYKFTEILTLFFLNFIHDLYKSETSLWILLIDL